MWLKHPLKGQGGDYDHRIRGAPASFFAHSLLAMAFQLAAVVLACLGLTVESAVSLKGKMEVSLDAKLCVRLLMNGGQVGCNVASKGGLSAPLHSIMTLTDLNVFTSNPPSERFAIFLNGTLFDTDNINSLEGSGGMAGMIVSPDGPPPKGFSPAPKDDFNKFGNALNMRKFDYPIAAVGPADAHVLHRKAEFNRDKDALTGGYPRYGINFKANMYAAEEAGADSASCLADRTCLPVGGYSTWSYLGPRPNKNATEGVIWATAAIDSTAVFHALARGGEAVSTTAAVVGAYAALAALPMKKTLAFGLFNGEAYERIGSRALVSDMESFKCDKQGDARGLKPYCLSPYRWDLGFDDMLGLSAVEAVVDIRQIVPSESGVPLHAHVRSSSYSNSSKLAARMAAGVSDIKVSDRKSVNLPADSSGLSFTAKKPDIAHVVLSGYADEYTNVLYHSRFDMLNESSLPLICSASNTIARALGRLAAADGIDDIAVDCQLVATIAKCLNGTCDLGALDYDALRTASWAGLTQYTSVYQSSELDPRVKFLAHALVRYSPAVNDTGRQSCKTSADCTARLELCILGKCFADINTTVFHHDALDPAIRHCKSSESCSFKVIDKTQRAWTESFWGSDLGVSFFVADSTVHDILLLVGGVVVTVLSAIGIFFATSYYNRHLKVG